MFLVWNGRMCSSLEGSNALQLIALLLLMLLLLLLLLLLLQLPCCGVGCQVCRQRV